MNLRQPLAYLTLTLFLAGCHGPQLKSQPLGSAAPDTLSTDTLSQDTLSQDNSAVFAHTTQGTYAGRLAETANGRV